MIIRKMKLKKKTILTDFRSTIKQKSTFGMELNKRKIDISILFDLV